MTNDKLENFPVIAVGGVLFHEGRVLLVKRGREPAKGLWAIPGGKIEPGEKLTDAVKREFLEETGIEVEAGEVVYVFDAIDLPKYHYVIIDYLVKMIGGDLRAGDDAEEVRWFAPDELDQYPVAPATVELLSQYNNFYKENYE